MATPTKYFYNSTKFPVVLKGDDGNLYYASPKSYCYLTVGLLNGFLLPDGIIEFALPNWWSVLYWPKARPWDLSYDPYANVRA